MFPVLCRDEVSGHCSVKEQVIIPHIVRIHAKISMHFRSSYTKAYMIINAFIWREMFLDLYKEMQNIINNRTTQEEFYLRNKSFFFSYFQNSFSDIARVLSEFFRDLDVVPGDVVVGLVLLRQRQQLLRLRVVHQVGKLNYNLN